MRSRARRNRAPINTHENPDPMTKEWWRIGTVNDGVKRSDNRGRANSKYSSCDDDDD
ncbi:hypothetical protein TorRG33x02_256960 [Trema orientale]|uniref:Uncharacterized protein n=1 Tax=Trema orientale TaxID=63057 RepID=A0A2P5DAN5_TREOI|nr:hypothetical protein TorRG33x02_256960 [Trema orientale]